jgi:hypothetical protein
MGTLQPSINKRLTVLQDPISLSGTPCPPIPELSKRIKDKE